MSCRENKYVLRQIRMLFLRLWTELIRRVLWGRRRYGQTRAVSRQNLLRFSTSRWSGWTYVARQFDERTKENIPLSYDEMSKMRGV
jgi:hypothetical protein